MICRHTRSLYPWNFKSRHYWINTEINKKKKGKTFWERKSPHQRCGAYLPAALWVDRLHTHSDGNDGRHHVSRSAGGRVRSWCGLSELLPRLPDCRGHPPSTPRQRYHDRDREHTQRLQQAQTHLLNIRIHRLSSDWFQLVGLIHDVGKIMALWDEPQVILFLFGLFCLLMIIFVIIIIINTSNILNVIELI